MNIRNTLITLSVIIAVLMIYAGVHLVALLDQMVANSQDRNRVDKIYHDFNKVHQGMEESLLLQGDKSLIAGVQERGVRLDQILKHALQDADSQYRPNLANFGFYWANYSGLLEELFALDQLVSESDQAMLLFIELVELNEVIEEQFGQLVQQIEQEETAQITDFQQRLQLFIVVLITTVVLILIYLYLRIVPALSTLSKAMRRISESGDLSIKLQAHHRHDEVGDLNHSFTHLIRSLQSSEQQLRDVDGKLEAYVAETRSILEVMDEGLVVIDNKGIILEVNQKINRMVGKSKKQLIGQSVLTLLKDSEQVGLQGLLDSFKSRIQRKHDKDRLAFDQLLVDAPVPLLVVNLDEIEHAAPVVIASQGFELSFGYSHGELVGRSIFSLLKERESDQLLHKVQTADREMSEDDGLHYHWKTSDGNWLQSTINVVRIESIHHTHVLIQVGMSENINWGLLRSTPYGQIFIEKDESQSGERPEQWQLVHQNGTLIPVNLSGSSIYLQESGEHQFNGAFFVVNDMRSLLTAEHAQEANLAKDNFLASISHELRTPLSTIIGNSEILSEVHLTPDQHQLLHTIEVSSRTLLALINDIIDFSKLSSGKFEIDESRYDLHTVFEELQLMFSSRFSDAGIGFEVKIQEPLSHYLVGDGQRIGQILINLLSNAIKYSEQGRVVLQSRIDQSRDTLHISVEDEGAGMTSEVMDRLFHSIEQDGDNTTRRFGGTGLGLHVSKRLAELMGGTIEVESELGQGSRFELVLPYRPGALLQQGSSQPQTETKQKFSGRVLIAEDTPELQLLERRILESMGLEVEVAGDGREAIELWSQGEFDLILMDMQMPEVDGIEATRKLRGMGCDIPIVALTANVMQKHRDAFDAVGGSGFLGKPIDRQILKQTLSQFLQS